MKCGNKGNGSVVTTILTLALFVNLRTQGKSPNLMRGKGPGATAVLGGFFTNLD